MGSGLTDDYYTILSNKMNLDSYVVNNNEGLDEVNRIHIYLLYCQDCNVIYFHKISHILKICLSKHTKSIFNNKINSGFAEHFIKNNHYLTLLYLVSNSQYVN